MSTKDLRAASIAWVGAGIFGYIMSEKFEWFMLGIIVSTLYVICAEIKSSIDKGKDE